ncbi:MAG: bifunctional diaminohydroxyphosphoribosylaminopyrimidine deaminase/5-amino-6-(5-phosphoribosylamino)uracil reductase RibD [Rhodospirillaceae bacterium]
MTAITAQDLAFMQNALELASRGLGTTAPNPSVGCILVNNDVVIGRGWTQPGGRPHAETAALSVAGESARGATAYVTLEPCCHHGKTPPCTDALIAAGVARVVVATSDPDDRVDGGGLAALEDAGIEVITGVLEAKARISNAGFFKAKRHGLPFIALKSATSLDGRIALKSGESQWISGEAARRYGHYLRATHDAIVVGSGTVVADNPSLTCRLPGYEDQARLQPVRVVLDRRLRIDPECTLAQTAHETPTWVVTSTAADADKVGTLESYGVLVLTAADPSDYAFARAAASVLAERGLTRVLVEGGGQIAASFLHDGLIDRIYAIRAPMIIGGDGKPAMAGLELGQLSDAPRFQRVETRYFGPDILEILDREPTV